MAVFMTAALLALKSDAKQWMPFPPRTAHFARLPTRSEIDARPCFVWVISAARRGLPGSETALRAARFTSALHFLPSIRRGSAPFLRIQGFC
jgi:hypothetical protein